MEHIDLSQLGLATTLFSPRTRGRPSIRGRSHLLLDLHRRGDPLRHVLLFEAASICLYFVHLGLCMLHSRGRLSPIPDSPAWQTATISIKTNYYYECYMPKKP
jgi:hypothetical protein